MVTGLVFLYTAGIFDALLSEQEREAVRHREFDHEETSRTPDKGQTSDCATWDVVSPATNVGVDGKIKIGSRR